PVEDRHRPPADEATLSRPARTIGHRNQPDPQLTRGSDRVLVVIWDEHRSRLHVEPVVKAVPERNHPSPGPVARLEHGDAMPHPHQLVRRREAGQPRARDDHLRRPTGRRAASPPGPPPPPPTPASAAAAAAPRATNSRRVIACSIAWARGGG